MRFSFAPSRRLPAPALLLCLAALWTSLAALAGGDTPTVLAGVSVIDARELAELAGSGARVIDTRAVHDFLAEHLPGAAHVDYKERSARSGEFDARDDDVPAFLIRLRKFAAPAQPVAFYCNGPSCWKSFKAAAAARAAGYRSVYWFRGGLSEWKQAGRPVVRE